MTKPRFHGRFHDHTYEDGTDTITLTVDCQEGYTDRQSAPRRDERQTVCAYLLKRFHAERKLNGFEKCEVVFDGKAIDDRPPPRQPIELPPEVVDLDVADVWF